MAAPTPSAKFSAAIGSDYATWTALVGNEYASGRLSRAEAKRVPALQAARNYVCSLAYLPLHCMNANGERVDRQLFNQPESLKGLAYCVTMAKTLEDLFYDASALWLVVQRDATGFPTAVERIEFGKWTQDESGTIRINGHEIRNPLDVIKFDSPNDPVLLSAAAAARMLIRLESTAAMYASQPEASEYFQPVQGQSPDENDVQEFLDDWHQKRRQNATAFIPSEVDRHEIKRMTAEELQLMAARDYSKREIANTANINPYWLGVPGTNDTYQNLQDARRQLADFTFAPYIHAVEQRLSFPDVTPRGQYVQFVLDGWLRANTSERYTAYSTALASGFLTLDEVRDLEDRPPLPETQNDQPQV